MYMQQERTDQILLYIFLVIGVVLLGILLVQFAGNQASLPSLTQSSSLYGISDITVQNQIMAQELLLNHQASGLAPNWNIYARSINWADYPIAMIPPMMSTHPKDRGMPF